MNQLLGSLRGQKVCMVHSNIYTRCSLHFYIMQVVLKNDIVFVKVGRLSQYGLKPP